MNNMTTREIAKVPVFIRPYWRYFDFRGRSQRDEFWLFALILVILGVAVETTVVDQSVLYLLATVLGLSVIPFLAVSVRRLHDSDRSGWWVWLLITIPLFYAMLMYFGKSWQAAVTLGIAVVSVFWFLSLMSLAGTKGENRFGAPYK